MQTRKAMTAVAVLSVIAGSINNAGCIGSSCLVEGTQVRTPDGDLPIETLKVGQKVISYDDELRAVSSELVATRSSVADKYLRIETNRILVVDCTAPHPIRTKEGWQKAGKLKTGDEICTEAGWQSIESITIHDGPVRVFDISVSPFQNFVANGFIVHNKIISVPCTVDDVEGIWICPLMNETEIWILDLKPDNTATLTSIRGARHVEERTTHYSDGKWKLTDEGRQLECTIMYDLDGKRDQYLEFEAGVEQWRSMRLTRFNFKRDCDRRETFFRPHALSDKIAACQEAIRMASKMERNHRQDAEAP